MGEPTRRISEVIRANWLDSLLAVIAGNAIYFLIVEPRLPERLRHQLFHLDFGLLIDFTLCLALLALIRWLRNR